MFSSKDIFFAPPSGGYRIEKSLRFRASASAYLSRTPGSASDRKKWTLSLWLKRGGINIQASILQAGTNGTNDTGIYFRSTDNAIDFYNRTSSTINGYVTTVPVYRDPSAWYHFVFVYDSANATAANRMLIYCNGVSQTLTVNTTLTQNTDGFVNSNVAHYIGILSNSTAPLDGYLAEVNLIDGQALTPSSFGETDATTGVWKPKAYTGTYGTNGFYLKFTDVGATSSSNTGYGKDFAGTNYWTTNNFGTTSTATTYDSMRDTPTPYDDGGNGVGNYAVLNPLTLAGSGTGTMSNANMTLTAPSATATAAQCAGSIGVSSGKYYWEETFTTLANASGYLCAGLQDARVVISGLSGSSRPGTNTWWISDDGNYRANGGTITASGLGSFAAGDTAMIAVDMTNGIAWIGKNGTWVGSPSAGTGNTFSSLPAIIAPFAYAGINTTTSSVLNANFGQRPFAYTPPSGFKALNTQNLPTPTIAAGDDYFNVILYTGTGASNARTGVGFQPDLVWIKERNAAADHGLYDAVRGVQKQLESNTTTAETTETTGLTAFGTDGFTVGALAQLNTNNDTYVAWNWKANGAGVLNTSGSVNSTVSANTTAGFSVCAINAPGGTTFTFGHGLGVAPNMVIVKSRTSTASWLVYHSSVTTTNQYLVLNSTAAVASVTNIWGTSAPTATVMGGNSSQWGTGSDNYIAYCFAAVAGYSAFGSYTGNGSTDGPFVFTGFRPRWILTKETSAAGNFWIIHDTARDTYNAATLRLYPNASDAEATATDYDILSNGFKLRTTSTPNISGSTYIYAAFAENPFSKALAR
jgi:hypothetical protein